jgi:hypothetical protein
MVGDYPPRASGMPGAVSARKVSQVCPRPGIASYLHAAHQPLGTEPTMKKILTIIAILFVLFVIATAPGTAADSVRWVAGAITAVFQGLLQIFQSL